MKKHGYGKGYKYPHDFENHFVNETYLPEEIEEKVFYSPSEQGSEKAIKERLNGLWPERYKNRK
jgi:putative ATPase